MLGDTKPSVMVRCSAASAVAHKNSHGTIRRRDIFTIWNRHSAFVRARFIIGAREFARKFALPFLSRKCAIESQATISAAMIGSGGFCLVKRKPARLRTSSRLCSVDVD